MNHRIVIAFAAACGLVAAGIACSVTPPAADPATDDGQLGVASSDELLGTLSYGQTSAPVPYTSAPRYRAFAFEGHAGDAVDIVIHTVDGVAMGWLQDNASQTVAYDFATTHDAHISQQLPSSGTFLIVFREAALLNATFTVSLSEAPITDGGTDVVQDGSTDAGVSDSGSSDAQGLDAAVDTGATCTFTRTLTGVNGCSTCVLPQPMTLTDPLSILIDDAGGGAYDFQIDGGKGRTLHMVGVSSEFSTEGCSYPTLALDGVPPAESWTASQASLLSCSNASLNASITVTNGDQVSVSYSIGHSPGVPNCGIIHGCVIGI